MLPMQQLTRPDGTPVRVLVVDDEVNIAELLAMALRYEGWDLQVAHTGTDRVLASSSRARMLATCASESRMGSAYPSPMITPPRSPVLRSKPTTRAPGPRLP